MATNLAGAYDFSNVNGFVASGTYDSGSLGVSGAGTRMVWYPRKAAFRAGQVSAAQWDDVNIGRRSTAMGYNTTASGLFSTAIGAHNTATNWYAVALGNSTDATGHSSTAMGGGTLASGSHSTAMGSSTEASGNNSTAMGSIASTNGQVGAFVYGDYSTSASNTLVTATAPNQFVVRAAGGTTFYSNAAMNAGVRLAAGGGAWAGVSDVRLKENFRDLDGEDVLARLARIPIREWSYKSQDASIRHVGPTAQDFRAAFGLGEDDRTINTLDPDGIALRAIQALDARTYDTQTDVVRLKDENAALRAELAALRHVVERLLERTR